MKISEEQRQRYLANKRAKYASDPEERQRRKDAAQRWRKANPDRKRELNRAYDARNPDKKAQWSRAYRDSPRGKQKSRERYESNREQVIQDQRLRRTGFTEELRLEMLKKQDGRCAICRDDLSNLPRRHVHADHCHETLTPRGVLCNGCNAGLGFFKDDPERMRAAIAYLESHREG